ncbi:nuclear transport factor 2 family protein [Actinospica sp.]|jgi:predicted SnoaL-like aldol condensation-catalyzing enzyme|uniref:nuclear transport factor 2 family protein n=1 Tax=Actinospica sp. TaxID=1872142 RepID=UPI002CB2F9A1|nr:ester cyclase [Actinospica sp.]HWG25699.1 ester cyclase [Actinospica sp.]
MRRARLVQLSIAAAAAAAAFALLPTASASAAGTSASRTASSTTPATQSASDRQAEANKALVLYVQDQLWNDGNYSVIDKYVSADYLQHNPTVANGPDALRNLVIQVRAAVPQLHITAVREVAEGDLVFLQNESGNQANFDIYRVENGKLVEHWDVLETAPTTTANGNDPFSQLSQPAGDSAPAAVTAQDKGVVLDYVTTLMQDHDLSAIDRYVAPSVYQHDPAIANGSAALTAYYSSLFAQNPWFGVQIAQVVAEGDLVAVHAHVKDAPSNLGQAAVYLFRVEGGRIVEQWGSAENVPATSANDNTMF